MTTLLCLWFALPCLVPLAVAVKAVVVGDSV
jgi:hypothetical protein